MEIAIVRHEYLKPGDGLSNLLRLQQEHRRSLMDTLDFIPTLSVASRTSLIVGVACFEPIVVRYDLLRSYCGKMKSSVAGADGQMVLGMFHLRYLQIDHLLCISCPHGVILGEVLSRIGAPSRKSCSHISTKNFNLSSGRSKTNPSSHQLRCLCN